MFIKHVRKHERNFVIIDKQCLEESTLSWKAKGLHSYIMSLPPDWQINIKDLATRSKDARDSVRTALKELEDAGYLKRSRTRSDDGRMSGWVCEVYERKDLQS